MMLNWSFDAVILHDCIGLLVTIFFGKKKHEKDCLLTEISWAEIVLGVGEITHTAVSGPHTENGQHQE